jgi:hypothetical protein
MNIFKVCLGISVEISSKNPFGNFKQKLYIPIDIYKINHMNIYEVCLGICAEKSSKNP